MLVYDPKQHIWRSVAPMPTARTRLRLVALGRYLYAIGGQPDPAGPSLTTVERYDPKSNRWITMTPMVQSRVPALRGRDQGRTPARARRRWRIRPRCSTHHRGL